MEFIFLFEIISPSYSIADLTQPIQVIERTLAGEIGIGVISGIVTALLFWILRSLWLYAIEPKLYNFVYRGVRIDGIWNSSFRDSQEDYSEVVDVTQIGHKILGTLSVRSGPDAGSQYRFQGEFDHMILTATYTSNSKRSLDRGTFSLKIGQNGTLMKGISSYYNDQTEQIEHAKYEWKRAEAIV